MQQRQQQRQRQHVAVCRWRFCFFLSFLALSFSWLLRIELNCLFALLQLIVVPQPTVNAGGVGGSLVAWPPLVHVDLLYFASLFFGAQRAFKEVSVSVSAASAANESSQNLMRYYCRALETFYRMTSWAGLSKKHGVEALESPKGVSIEFINLFIYSLTSKLTLEWINLSSFLYLIFYFK